jgi:hypothetical protein
LRRDNRSGFKGIYLRPGRKLPWTAYIRVNKKAVHLGQFARQADAVAAYDAAAVKFFGEFAATNQDLLRN